MLSLNPMIGIFNVKKFKLQTLMKNEFDFLFKRRIFFKEKLFCPKFEA